MANVLKPPHVGYDKNTTTIFLAGSIEMGSAIDWQLEIEKRLEDHNDITLFNPRRDDWDWTWEQSINNPKFYEQVNWELDHLEAADIIVLNFCRDTKSPISLLELGKIHGMQHKNVIVCCPDGFWRKGNVDIVCERSNFAITETFDEMFSELIKEVEEVC